MIKITIAIITVVVIWFSVSTPEECSNCHATVLQQTGK